MPFCSVNGLLSEIQEKYIRKFQIIFNSVTFRQVVKNLQNQVAKYGINVINRIRLELNLM